MIYMNTKNINEYINARTKIGSRHDIIPLIHYVNKLDPSSVEKYHVLIYWIIIKRIQKLIRNRTIILNH